MASKTDEKRMANYEALKAYILERDHLPDKHVKTYRSLLSWANTKGRRSRKVRWTKRSENCVNHYSPLVQMSILGAEGRKPNEQYLTIWSFSRVATSVRTKN